jgi:hypothetical protein
MAIPKTDFDPSWLGLNESQRTARPPAVNQPPRDERQSNQYSGAVAGISASLTRIADETTRTANWVRTACWLLLAILVVLLGG